LTGYQLETPPDPDDIYEARGPDEVAELRNRPLFTGDVLIREPGIAVCLLQHPCAMRRGPQLLPLLLTGAIVPSEAHRTEWRNHTPTEMPLPGLPGLGSHPSISFLDLATVDSAGLESAQRVAVLSRLGVNLLMQRWIYHNCRLVVPTITIDAAVSAQHEEADLTMECVDELTATGLEVHRAQQLADSWLDEQRPDGVTIRHLLVDPQSRSTARRWMRNRVADYLSDR